MPKIDIKHTEFKQKKMNLQITLINMQIKFVSTMELRFKCWQKSIGRS